MLRFIFPILSLIMFSEEEIRFTHTYKQGFDTSCGIAVTATLLNNFWNIPIEEADMYNAMLLSRYHEGDMSYTISFLTISNYLIKYNIQARAYKMDWTTLQDTLSKGFAPIIINYDKPNAHFALLVYMENDYAFVADPAKGFELVEREHFEKNFSGNVLLTASNTASKNTERIEQIRQQETLRLEQLQRLTFMRGRW